MYVCMYKDVQVHLINNCAFGVHVIDDGELPTEEVLNMRKLRLDRT